MSKTYANKSNAKRAAVAFCKADGLPENSFCLQQDVDGKWWFEVVTPAAPKAPRYRLVRRARKAAVVAPTPTVVAAPATMGKHKEFQLYGRSSAISPVKAVHDWLNVNGKGITRKEALFQLAQLGINYATARTQYQKWFSANK